MKIHANLKWATIIDRLNKQAGYEKFTIQHDAIYVTKNTYTDVIIAVTPVFETQENPVFPALDQEVFVEHKVKVKKVKTGVAKFFIANFGSDKENFIEKWA